jgi:hypothetical protein
VVLMQPKSAGSTVLFEMLLAGRGLFYAEQISKGLTALFSTLAPRLIAGCIAFQVAASDVQQGGTASGLGCLQVVLGIVAVVWLMACIRMVISAVNDYNDEQQRRARKYRR